MHRGYESWSPSLSLVTGLAVSHEAAWQAAFACALAKGAIVVAQGRAAGLCAWHGGDEHGGRDVLHGQLHRFLVCQTASHLLLMVTHWLANTLWQLGVHAGWQQTKASRCRWWPGKGPLQSLCW